MMHPVRRFGTTLLLVAVPALVLASPSFHRRWHWSIADTGRSAAQLPDGGYIISGGMEVTTDSFGVVLARTDSLGNTLSVHQILHTDAGGGFSCRVVDGGYAVLAESGGRIFVRRFSPVGDSLWNYQSTWGGPISAIIPTLDGGCLVAGRIPDTAYDMGAIKLAPDGHEEWARGYDEPRMYDSWAHGAAQTRDGGYVLCGEATDYTSVNMRLARLQPNGDSAWTRLYHGPIEPMLNDVREMSDGGFLAVGSEFDTSGSHAALYMMRTNSAGDTVWTRHLSPPGGATRAAAMCATRDGGYVIAGTIDWGDSARAWLVKTYANAETTWTSVLPGTGREQATDVEQTADGGYVVAGSGDAEGGVVLVVKTDSLGRVGVEECRPTAPGRAVLSVVPNPASGVVRIDCSLPASVGARLRLYDVAGNLVQTLAGVARCALPVAGLAKGVYLLKLDYDRGTATRKLVVE